MGNIFRSRLLFAWATFNEQRIFVILPSSFFFLLLLLLFPRLIPHTGRQAGNPALSPPPSFLPHNCHPSEIPFLYIRECMGSGRGRKILSLPLPPPPDFLRGGVAGHIVTFSFLSLFITKQPPPQQRSTGGPNVINYEMQAKLHHQPVWNVFLTKKN